jgi:hypothetical protein
VWPDYVSPPPRVLQHDAARRCACPTIVAGLIKRRETITRREATSRSVSFIAPRGSDSLCLGQELSVFRCSSSSNSV